MGFDERTRLTKLPNKKLNIRGMPNEWRKNTISFSTRIKASFRTAPHNKAVKYLEKAYDREPSPLILALKINKRYV